MPFPTFDRSRLRLRPLAERAHDLTLDHWLALEDPVEPYEHPDLATVAARIRAARRRGAAVILLMGGHVIRAGVARHLIELLERGLVSHLAMNGAAAIHDYELALIGATTESVARYVREGQFGLWAETGGMNDAVVAGVRDGLGMGEALGRAVEEGRFPQKDLSVLAACYRLRVPATVHVGIGYDIIHEHPNCDGAALGAASYHDFLILAQTILGAPTPSREEGTLTGALPSSSGGEGSGVSGGAPTGDHLTGREDPGARGALPSPRGAVERYAMAPHCAAPGGEGLGVRGGAPTRREGSGLTGLEGGVVLSFGTAVMGPEIFLKALAMARNVALQEGREIAHFTSAVFDLLPLSGDLHHEARKGTPEYYFRPYKTLLVRTVAGGGESYYFRGDHRATVPALWRALRDA